MSSDSDEEEPTSYLEDYAALQKYNTRLHQEVQFLTNQVTALKKEVTRGWARNAALQRQLPVVYPEKDQPVVARTSNPVPAKPPVALSLPPQQHPAQQHRDVSTKKIPQMSLDYTNSLMICTVCPDGGGILDYTGVCMTCNAVFSNTTGTVKSNKSKDSRGML